MSRPLPPSVLVVLAVSSAVACGRLGIEDYSEGQASTGGSRPASTAGSGGSGGAQGSGSSGTGPVAGQAALAGSGPGGSAGKGGNAGGGAAGAPAVGGGTAGTGGIVAASGASGGGGGAAAASGTGGVAGAGGSAGLGGAAAGGGGGSGAAGSGAVGGVAGSAGGTAGGGGTAGAIGGAAGSSGTGGAGTLIGSPICDAYRPAEPNGSVYRVSPTGDDNTDCAYDHPCRTLQHASSVVSAPGSLVLVDDGTYDGFYTEHAGIWFRANGNNVVINTSQDGPVGVTGDNINIEGTDGVVIQGFIVRDATRCGIRIAASSNVVVMDNRVGPNDNHGIFAGFAPAIRFLNNETFDCAAGGGITHTNSDTPNDDFVICGNISHHNSTGIQVEGDCSAGGDGILENGVVVGNIVYQSAYKGLSLSSAPGGSVYNNILHDNGLSGGAAGIHLATTLGCGDSYASSDTVVFNNTLYEPNIAAVRLTDGVANAVLFNNIFTGRATAVVDEVGLSDVDGSNIIQATLDGLNLTAEYRLQLGSAAVDAGLADYAGLHAPSLDIDGTTRPQGGAVDVGAHELP